MTKWLTRLLSVLMVIGLFAPLQAKLFDAKTFTLANGLKVLVLENDRVNLVTHMVGYKVGCADSPVGKSGIAHYLEHMMFKGPKGSGAAEFSNFVDAVGGNNNAMTSQDSTVYYAVVPKEHLEKVMGMESERMAKLEVLDDQAKPELKVVLEEWNMRIGNSPQGKFATAIDSAFFTRHPYRIPTIGWRDEIESYTPDDVRKFYNDWYAPNNAVLILSGNITLTEAQQLCEKYYGSIKQKKLPKRHRDVEPPMDKKLKLEMTSNKIDLPYISISYPAPNFKADNLKEVYALQVLSYVLGGSSTSVLYKKFVERDSTASAIYASYDEYNLDPQSFSIQAQLTGKMKHGAFEDALMTELKRLADRGFTKKEIENGKSKMLSGLVYIRDSLMSGADHLLQTALLDIPLDVMESWPEGIKAVTAEDVNKAFKKIFNAEGYLVGHLLPETPSKGTPQKPGMTPVPPVRMPSQISANQPDHIR